MNHPLLPGVVEPITSHQSLSEGDIDGTDKSAQTAVPRPSNFSGCFYHQTSASVVVLINKPQLLWLFLSTNLSFCGCFYQQTSASVHHPQLNVTQNFL